MRWHITGDSFVEGVGATGHRGWAQQVADSFPPGTVTINGIGGSTSADLVSRLPQELIDKPDNLVVSIGINDSRYRPSLSANEVSLVEFRHNIERLIEISCDAGTTTTYLIGLTRVAVSGDEPLKPDKFYRNDAIAAYDAPLREAAAHHQHVKYVTVPLLDDVEDHLADGLHPSDRGHQALFGAIVGALQNGPEEGGPP